MRSKLLKDVMFISYGKNNFSLISIFEIQLLQNNTYYYPISNPEYAAYTDKDNFKVYIDYSINEYNSFKGITLPGKFKHFIRRNHL